MVRVGSFRITSRVVSGGSVVSSVPGTSPNAQHQVHIVNRSTLPYDCIVAGSIMNGLLQYVAGSAAWPSGGVAVPGSGAVAPAEDLNGTTATGSETLCCHHFVSRLAGAPGWGPTVNPGDCSTVTVT